jgi:hypothetical protein
MSSFKVISSSEIFKTLVKYMDRGDATTPEVIIMEKNGVEFNISFKFRFTYDWSNGMNASEPEITIIKSNGKEPTALERKTIESYIEKNYRW